MCPVALVVHAIPSSAYSAICAAQRQREPRPTSGRSAHSRRERSCINMRRDAGRRSPSLPVGDLLGHQMHARRAAVITSGRWGVYDVTDEGYLSGIRRVVDTLSQAVSTTHPRRCRSRDLRQSPCRRCFWALLLARDLRRRHVYLARASARGRAYTADETSAETSTETSTERGASSHDALAPRRSPLGGRRPRLPLHRPSPAPRPALAVAPPLRPNKPNAMPGVSNKSAIWVGATMVTFGKHKPVKSWCWLRDLD